MTTQQYLRAFSLVVTGSGGAIDLSNLRCTFNIRRGDIQTPNSLDCRVWNVSSSSAQNTAQRLNSPEFSTITVKAGYSGNFAQVFTGSIKQVRLGRANATDTYVDITAADSDRPYNFAPIALPLASADPTSVINNIAAAIVAFADKHGDTLTLGPLPTFTGNPSPRGIVTYGSVKDQIRQFCEQNDCVWSIQDGVITIIPRTQYLAAPPVVISPATGLVGVPEQTANGIEVKCLLNPSIKIGTSVNIQGTVNALRYGLDQGSQTNNLTLQGQVGLNADGNYYVMSAQHTGDTRGTPWYTELICLSISATIPPGIELQNKFFSTDDVVPRAP